MAPQGNSHLSKINPEFAELLKTLPAAPSLEGDIPTLRATLSERKKALTASLLKDTKGVARRDIAVSARDGHKIAVRVYTPESSPAGKPLIIFLHGGGFCLGGLENEELLCTLFVQAHGVSVLNVDYRLAPEWKFPHAVNDSWDVVKWAAANASEVGADPTKGFIVGGISAGGGISAAVAHLARDEKLSPPLTGVCLLMPVVANTKNMDPKHLAEIKSLDELKDAPVLPQKTIEQFDYNYAPDPTSHLSNLFAPPVQFGGLPTTYFQVAGLDPLRDEAMLYERLLREENGVKTKLEVYPGLPHGFYSYFPTLKASADFIQDTVNGIGWLLANP